jgi:hypothetical protein
MQIASHWQAFARYLAAARDIQKVARVLPAAQIQTAGETNRSRWDHARVRLLIPIGIIVGVAIIGIAVGVLSSAERANRISTESEEQAILRSLDDNAERALRHLESVATMPQAATKIAIAMMQPGSTGALGAGSKRSTTPTLSWSSVPAGKTNISARAARSKELSPIWRLSSLRRLIFCAAGSPGNRRALSWYRRAIFPSRPLPSPCFRIFWADPRWLPR